jgi:ProP effector
LIATYSVYRNTQPLVIGIHKAILATHPEIGTGALRKALRRHTASTKYLKSVAAGGARFGLHGLPIGEVTAIQQEVANQTIKERFRKQAKQRRELLKVREHQTKLNQLVAKFTLG